jgi:hypothetical protein
VAKFKQNATRSIYSHLKNANLIGGIMAVYNCDNHEHLLLMYITIEVVDCPEAKKFLPEFYDIAGLFKEPVKL